ncbi:trans-sialidase, putative, partial [Trypanosoma cruzi marinkellei]
MHSRVAAVMAPRTHNRRRVTGSSGRRREGRESERQRPNMSRRVFTSAVLLLLVVVMMCNTCGTVAAEDAQGVEGPPSGQGTSKTTYFVWRDVKEEGETLITLHVPSLVEMNGEVFAVAEAQLRDDSGFTGIASELLELAGKENKKEELVTAQVKTQVLEECPSGEGKRPAGKEEKCDCHTAGQADSQSRTKVHVRRPTTVVNGGHIYMLAGNYSRTANATAEESGAVEWGLLLVKGNVSDDEKKGKRIQWNDTYAIPWNYNVKQQKNLTRLFGSGGSGVKMNDGTLVFPMEGTKKGKEGEAKEEGNTITVSLILYSSDARIWMLSKGMSADGCGDPSVVEWGKDG